MSDDNPLMCCCCRAAHQHIIEEKDAEIERLRLTDSEIEVLLWLAKVGGDTHPSLKTVTPEMRPILQGIVKRFGGRK